MKILCLVTHTRDCEKFWLSLEALGHDVRVEVYDQRGHAEHWLYVNQAERNDAVVYVGALEQFHERPVPKTDVLKAIGDRVPTIHICSDASEPQWFATLEEYDRRDVFAAQVSVDGNLETPIATFRNGLVLLTPVDPRAFKPRPWQKREFGCGFAGTQMHGERKVLVDAMGKRLTQIKGVSYAEMGRFFSRCRLVLNCPQNGAGTGDHVKGRVLEAGWGGACLLERRNPHTRNWFTPAVDYIEYDDPLGALVWHDWAEAHSEETRLIAENFRKKVDEHHHPRVFWRHVFTAAGIRCSDDQTSSKNSGATASRASRA
jgi:hypothetical protein